MPATKSKAATKPKAKSDAPAPAPANPAARPLKKGDHLFLVDGSGYIFRAYHALPPLTRKSDGLQVNAVLGFCNMLWKLLADMPKDDKPTHLAVIFDRSEEHTSELHHTVISYAVFCLKKKKKKNKEFYIKKQKKKIRKKNYKAQNY